LLISDVVVIVVNVVHALFTDLCDKKAYNLP